MAKHRVFWRTRTTVVNFSYFHFEWNAAYLAWASSQTSRRTEQIYRDLENSKIHFFFTSLCVGVAVAISYAPYTEKYKIRERKNRFYVKTTFNQVRNTVVFCFSSTVLLSMRLGIDVNRHKVSVADLNSSQCLTIRLWSFNFILVLCFRRS